MIVVDTNVVSEFMKPDVDTAVLAWAGAVPVGEMAIFVVTVQEIE